MSPGYELPSAKERSAVAFTREGVVIELHQADGEPFTCENVEGLDDIYDVVEALALRKYADLPARMAELTYSSFITTPSSQLSR
jgi:hypothetical protein